MLAEFFDRPKIPFLAVMNIAGVIVKIMINAGQYDAVVVQFCSYCTEHIPNTIVRGNQELISPALKGKVCT